MWTQSTDRWTEQILDLTNTPEFMNATVSIVDPELITVSGSWNIETNTPPTVYNNGVVADHIMARINWPLRSTRDPGTADADPSTIRSGRMSIRWVDYSGPLRNGMKVYVINGGDNPDLPRFVMTIEEALNGSNSASRVMKVGVDGEATGEQSVPIVGQDFGYGDPAGAGSYGN